MSQQDKKTSLDDLILGILEKYRALSTTQITKIVNEKYGFHYNRKTVERHVINLRIKGKVVANPPVGREQTYSASQEPVTVSEFFINQFWKNLDAIRHENLSNPFMAYLRLSSLVTMLPPDLKNKLLPDVQAAEQQFFTNLTSLAAEYKVYMDLKSFANSMGESSGSNSNLRKGIQATARVMMIRFVDDLIGKVSTLLHEQFALLRKNEKK